MPYNQPVVPWFQNTKAFIDENKNFEIHPKMTWKLEQMFQNG